MRLYWRINKYVTLFNHGTIVHPDQAVDRDPPSGVRLEKHGRRGYWCDDKILCFVMEWWANVEDLLRNRKYLTDEEYKEMWGKLGPIQLKMIEKIGSCRHNLGDLFVCNNPYHKPQEVCTALMHVLDLYTWRVALGFPSWEADN